ncbi:MAG: IS91 family transposase [Planctomycetes bacterium]|nr:IS91 family transposase [Planctomycetota bacterium]
MTNDAGNKRPLHSVGEILRRWGPEYTRTHAVPPHQRRAMQALAACRTAALGGHLEQCTDCGHERPVYNSCGNRHCPTCQGQLARAWLAQRLGEVLNALYFHCIFTIPDTFNVLVPYNARVIYTLLFEAAAGAIQHLMKTRLGVEAGIVAVLHTWGQTLWPHPHIHCIVTGGGLTPDRRQWVATAPDLLFDVGALSCAFRERFCAGLRAAKLTFAGDAARLADPAAFEALIATEEKRDWVVHSKPPVAGPRQVLEYLSRYTHRVAISNWRILEVTDDGAVTFQYQDWHHKDAHGRPPVRKMTLSATEFIGRFLRHILPRGFRKVRCYGLLAGRHRQQKLAAARALLGEPVAEPEARPQPTCPDPTCCPVCAKGRMQTVARLHRERAPPIVHRCELRRPVHAA